MQQGRLTTFANNVHSLMHALQKNTMRPVCIDFNDPRRWTHSVRKRTFTHERPTNSNSLCVRIGWSVFIVRIKETLHLWLSKLAQFRFWSDRYCAGWSNPRWAHVRIPAGTWRKYNVASTSMHDVASTLRRRYIYVMCLPGCTCILPPLALPITTEHVLRSNNPKKLKFSGSLTLFFFFIYSFRGYLT